MVWLFALGIIALAVMHRGFRKVCLWLLATGATITAVYVVGLMLSGKQW